jgi:osmoprotectant transport system ATP-binding protein
MDEALSMADKIIFMDRGNITQIAAPEEMLRNPACDLIRSFMGKRGKDAEVQPRTASDFMFRKVYAVSKTFGVHEAVELMARKRVDTLIVKNLDGTYAGTVGIQSLKYRERDVKTIERLIKRNYSVSYIDEEAQQCFDKLFSGEGSYVVVLNHDDTVAGIVTKTSAAKALAEAVWGAEDA